MNRRAPLLIPLAVAVQWGAHVAPAQVQNTYRVFNITLNTSAPAQLAMDRGRLIWRDTDINSGNQFFRFYWGQGIATLDSGLAGLTCAISGDRIVWNTSAEEVKSFDCRTWVTTDVGLSYNPDFAQPVSVAGDVAAYARRNGGTGTNVVLHRFTFSSDTLLSAGAWNTSPSVNDGEVAWVVSDSESGRTSDVYLFDGWVTKNISMSPAARNRSPVARDGQVAWLSGPPDSSRVRLFTGDSVVTVAQSPGKGVVVAGYDLSDGIAVAALRDTTTGSGTIRIYDSGTAVTTVLSDTTGVYAVHISNGLVAWQSGSGPQRSVRTYSIPDALTGSVSAGENPVMDHDLIAWTYGDAVEMRRPVTFTQLTTDGQNGWEQTKFKTIDSGRVVWGNFANSLHARLFYSDGNTTRQLTDSSVTHDLIMANGGYVVWRSNFDSMYYFDGIHDPVRFVDTVQAENPYVAGGFISFNGLRLAEGTNVKHAWLYDIVNNHLTQLTKDSTNCENVMCERNTACWLNADTGVLMFYDGATEFPLSDSLVDSKYSYRNGILVWCERKNGVMQVMLYDARAKTKSALTSGPPDKSSPVTDGRIVIWYENPVFTVTTASADMHYYDTGTGRSVVVPGATYQTTNWSWMSDGSIVWPVNGNIYLFDGDVVSQLTGDDFNVNTSAYLDRGTLVWQRTPPPPTGTNGQIYTGTLTAHPSFEASSIAGPAPLSVSFTNRSWEGVRSLLWDFGDGTSSGAVNPVHTYAAPGKYTVTLTVTGPTGSVRERKHNLVRVRTATSVAAGNGAAPGEFSLFQNYPNPFNPSTAITYSIPGAAHVTLAIYDVLGRIVATPVDGEQGGGVHSVTWDASTYSSGVYYCRLRSRGQTLVRAMVLLR